MSTADLKSFHYLENDEIQFSMFSTEKSVKKLDSGFYSVSMSNSTNPPILTLKVIKAHEISKIHDFPDKKKIDKLFDAFFDTRVKETVKNLDFFHKIGVLLHGKEGTGKTTIMRYYATRAIIEHHAIVFYLNNSFIKDCWAFIERIRKVQDNPIVIIYDEFDQHVGQSGHLSAIKLILDGNSSIDNCIFLAATNHIEQIPEAIKNRPSRFKYVLDIEGIQDPKDIEDILLSMIKNLFKPKEITEFANQLKGEALDFIKQFAMDKIMDIKTYSHTNKKPIGFNK